jgi:hypothetical protein
MQSTANTAHRGADQSLLTKLTLGGADQVCDPLFSRQIPPRRRHAWFGRW